MSHPFDSQPTTTTDPMSERIRHLRRLIADTHAQIRAIDTEEVRGYFGGTTTVAAAQQHAAELEARVRQESRDGDKRHKRVPNGYKALAVLPLATDFLIVGIFLASVFNVALSDPLSTPAESLTVLTISLIVTVGLAVTLRWIGTRRRGDKTSTTRIAPTRIGAVRAWLPRLELILLSILLVLVACVMLVRVANDAATAGIALGAGWVVAVFLAVITASLNWIIFLAEYHDGSDETHELDHWGKVLAPHKAARKALAGQAEAAQNELACLRDDARPPSTVTDPALGEMIPRTTGTVSDAIGSPGVAHHEAQPVPLTQASPLVIELPADTAA